MAVSEREELAAELRAQFGQRGALADWSAVADFILARDAATRKAALEEATR
jgi:hypothetical protein